MGHRAGQENLLESVHNVFNLTFVDGEEASGGEGVRDGAASRRSNACVVQQRHEDRLEVFEDVLNVVDGVELEAEEDAEVAAGDDLGTFSFLERSLDDVGERHAAVVDEIRNVLLAEGAADGVEGASAAGGRLLRRQVHGFSEFLLENDILKK